MTPTRHNLDSMMDFDRVVQVHADGTVTEAPSGIYAPELNAISHRGQHTAETDPDLHDQARRQGWTLEQGWTGQHGYSGPCMHGSEFIGGRLAEHILSTPGLWVAVVVHEYDDRDDMWAVAYREVTA